VWAEKNMTEHQHLFNVHEGLRAALEEMSERSRQRRRAKFIEHEPYSSD
jgi:hypothetical protein